MLAIGFLTRPRARLVAVAAIAAFAVLQALSELAVFRHGVVVSALPASAVRATAALALGAGLGAAGLVFLAPNRARAAAEDPAGAFQRTHFSKGAGMKAVRKPIVAFGRRRRGRPRSCGRRVGPRDHEPGSREGREHAAAVHALGADRGGERDHDEDRTDCPLRVRHRLVRAAAAPWKLVTKSTGSGDSAVFQKVTWTGGRTPTGLDSVFRFNGSIAKPGTVMFTVRQTYSDGKVVDWNQSSEASDTPAPRVEAVSSFGGGGTSTIEIVALVLAIAALVIAVIGLLGGGGKGKRELA